MDRGFLFENVIKTGNPIFWKENEIKKHRPVEFDLQRDGVFCCFRGFSGLLPFHGCRGLACDVIDHAVDMRDLIDDAGGNAA